MATMNLKLVPARKTTLSTVSATIAVSTGRSTAATRMPTASTAPSTFCARLKVMRADIVGFCRHSSFAASSAISDRNRRRHAFLMSHEVVATNCTSAPPSRARMRETRSGATPRAVATNTTPASLRRMGIQFSAR